jgi:tricarballylate dehydrogenase
MADIDTPAPGFVDDLVDRGGRVDRYARAVLADEGRPDTALARALGVEFGELLTIFLTQSHRGRSRWVAAEQCSTRSCTRPRTAGATIVYRSTAWRLELGDDGAVAGVRVRSADGSSSLGTTPVVVIASGGFEGNPEMMTRYVGRSVRTVALGGQHNRGEGIEMALAVGAQAAGDWSQFHAEPVDPRSAREEAVVMLYPYALLVDGAGRRFLDEVRHVDEQYEATARRILALPGALVGHRRSALFDLRASTTSCRRPNRR